jgi:DNA polymerase delta subunit 1
MKRQLPELKKEDLCWANNNPENLAEKEKWSRPSLPHDFDPHLHSINFQQLEIKYDIEESHSSLLKPTTEIGVPVIKIYGCSEEGYSVALSVYNFAPYIWVPVPPLSKEEEEEKGKSNICENFRQALENALKLKAKQTKKGEFEVNQYVTSVGIEKKMTLMGYHEEKSDFFKITFTSPKHVVQARSILEERLIVDGLDKKNVKYLTYESNVLFVLRFMIDCGIGGASWLSLKAGQYNLIPPNRRRCNTTIEAEVDCDALGVYKVDDESWSHNAPLRLLSFDIECAGRPGSFPDPTKDPVIQIANYVTVHGQEQPLFKNIFVLNSCAAISGVDVRCFQTERELLLAWSEFVLTIDPDIMTGYNIVKFDFIYLKERAEALGLNKFPFFTRLVKGKISVKDAKFSSAQTGTRESKEWFIEGRIVFDVFQVIQKDHKLSSYTLNNVSSHFLGEQKEDVHHSMITKLHEGTKEDRRRLAIYCCKDAYLPQRLINSQMCLVQYIEMARVTGVPFTFLLTRGQGIKVTTQILKKSRELDYLFPTSNPSGEDSGFQGAKVFEPKVGFYTDPILTLDFASLYPSIMQAHNLCYTTFIPGKVPEGWIKDVDYEVTPTGAKFVTVTRKRGILNLILSDLLGARGNAKRLMANAPTKALEQVYNGRQLALKVSANSVYGFTGQSNGSLCCVDISASVTSYGRDMIILTQQTVEEECSIKNGYTHNAQVVYGDTDSVMVWSGLKTVSEAIVLGKKLAALVSTKFPKPIKLEFEKVYHPWLLMSKKKYAGLFWTKPDKYDKVDCKGIESVRRDNCKLARHAVQGCIDKILIEKDIVGALEFGKGLISDLLQNKVDLSLLIVTKSYGRDAESYKSPQAHIALAQKMKKRDPATAPSVGDRIPFVIISGEKKAKMWEKAEDPLYVLEHGIPIDSQYYIEQLISPLCRIFGPILSEDPRTVFTTGPHTTKKVLPKTNLGVGLARFMVVEERCLGCKGVLKANQKTLCYTCREREVDIYSEYLANVRLKEMEFNRMWTQCQNCQGSYHQAVICVANDCPIFYKRTKTRMDLKDAQKTLKKFDLTW